MRESLFTRSLAVLFILGASVGHLRAAETNAIAKPITVADVNAAQQAWCDGLVKIGEIYRNGGDYKAFASKFIDDMYDFAEGRVFFKPTLAFGDYTFRKDKEGTMAYFVGGNPAFSKDTGFALAVWEKVTYDNGPEDNLGVQIHGDIALTMGNVYLTDKLGNEVMVDKTFAFRRGSDGKLRLIIHKSALPYTPPVAD
jgi:hypothetical protein